MKYYLVNLLTGDIIGLAQNIINQTDSEDKERKCKLELYFHLK